MSGEAFFGNLVVIPEVLASASCVGLMVYVFIGVGRWPETISNFSLAQKPRRAAAIRRAAGVSPLFLSSGLALGVG